LPEPFYNGITDALGDAQIDLIHPVEFAGQPGFLFLQRDAAAFVRYEEPVTEVIYLGDLTPAGSMRNGFHSPRKETTSNCSSNIVALASGHHESFTKPFRRPGDWLPDDEILRTMDRGERLRKAFARLRGFDIPPAQNADSAR
jgi:hypothetical protein